MTMTTEMEKYDEAGKIAETEGRYLARDLQGMAKKTGRMILIANYVCDLNDVIARKDENGEFEVAGELKNNPDWRLFQELTAQADVVITGAGYLKRFAKAGEGAENVIDQFAKGGQFEELGNWRVEHKLKRNPDIAIVSRSLDFDIPQTALKDGRKVMVFTTHEGAVSPKAKELEEKGVLVIGAGKAGVDGKIMIDFLILKMGYNVAKMTTGPRVLKILLDANVLDELYITRVQREILARPEDTQTILGPGKKVSDLPGFVGKKLFHQEGIKTADGEMASQDFWVYDNKKLLDRLSL